MRAILVLAATSTLTVVAMWFTNKLHLGFIASWVVATAIIFVGAYAARAGKA